MEKQTNVRGRARALVEEICELIPAMCFSEAVSDAFARLREALDVADVDGALELDSRIVSPGASFSLLHTVQRSVQFDGACAMRVRVVDPADGAIVLGGVVELRRTCGVRVVDDDSGRVARTGEVLCVSGRNVAAVPLLVQLLLVGGVR